MVATILLYCFRLLEDGNLTAAENMKMQLEQTQRERRKRQDAEQVPRWFK